MTAQHQTNFLTVWNEAPPSCFGDCIDYYIGYYHWLLLFMMMISDFGIS